MKVNITNIRLLPSIERPVTSKEEAQEFRSWLGTDKIQKINVKLLNYVSNFMIIKIDNEDTEESKYDNINKTA